jgi:hypothetical protein
MSAKNGFGTTQRKGVGRRDERKRRHDDFIARPHIEQQRRHFQRVCARGHKQRFEYSQFILQQLLTAARENSITRNMAGRNRLQNVFGFGADQSRFIERYFKRRRVNRYHLARFEQTLYPDALSHC